MDLAKDQRALAGAIHEFNKQADGEAIIVDWVGDPDHESLATRVALAKALEAEADIFHFAGHGKFNEGQEGFILLEKEKRRADQYEASFLAQLLSSANVRLAFLGACDSGRRDDQNVWSGVAPALARQGAVGCRSGPG